LKGIRGQDATGCVKGPNGKSGIVAHLSSRVLPEKDKPVAVRAASKPFAPLGAPRACEASP